MKRFNFFGNRNPGVSTLTFRMWEFTGTALLNLLIFIILLAYLSPLVYMGITSLKEKAQLTDPKAPLYPAVTKRYIYEGKEYPVYSVPDNGVTKEWVLVKRYRKYSEFLDPANPQAGLIHWDGSWRQLDYVYRPQITFDNYIWLWTVANFPQSVLNTLIVAGLGEIGVLMASIAVAYGFSRFRIPGGKWLFLLLIGTILIPDSITLVPTYMLFTRILHWNGSWLPLIVPQFFGNAIFIFLLRQNFKSIPRDLDEAAMLDGAGPLRILFSIILPQSIPAVATVALLHFFYVWNELRMASFYLGIAPHLRTVSFSVQMYQSLNFTPEILEASALMVMLVPVLILFVFQRFFMQDMVITGTEK